MSITINTKKHQKPPMSAIKKLALGTVQFGLDYGISNTAGKVSYDAARQILTHAFDQGVRTLDTAVAYGDSEKVIGTITAQNNLPFAVISKLPPDVTEEHYHDHVEQSLQRLQTQKLHGLLFHRCDDFKKPELQQCITTTQKDGVVEKIGVSVNYTKEVEWILENQIACGIVQLPFSVFDQRFRPYFKLLQDQNIEIHVRSVFLQGLYFMDPADLAPHFAPIKAQLLALHELSAQAEIPLATLLLNYALMQPEIDKTVIGITKPAELQHNITGITFMDKMERLQAELDSFASTDETILLPCNWS